MKFQHNLETHLTPEWRTQYIEYRLLKDMIVNAVAHAPTADTSAYAEYFAAFKLDFFELCDKELEKINMFYDAKLAEITHKYTVLKDELRLVKDKMASSLVVRPSLFSRSFRQNQMLDMTRILTRDEKHDFKAAFSEVYLNVILLRNYQIMNHTGFRKILKKYDKRIRSKDGQQYFEANVDIAPFHTNVDTKKLLHKIEDIMTHSLEHGNRHKAMERLRVPPLADQSHPWTSFRTGFSLGALIVLAIMVVLSFTMRIIDVDVIECVLLFRAPFTMILFLGLISLNVYVWRFMGINHVLIFQLDPRNYLAAVQILEISVVFGCILSVLTLAFLHAKYLKMPPYVFPLAMPLIMLIFLINPLRIFHYRSRMWLLRYFGRIACAPFFSVVFADFWLADQFNSLMALFVDYTHIICYYTTTVDWYRAKEGNICDYNQRYFAIMRILPAWFRFAQCLRRCYDDPANARKYLINAGKYSTTFFVVFFEFMRSYYADSYSTHWENPFTYFWMISATVSSSYGMAWDYLMDWGLFKTNGGPNKFLRPQILYRPGFYYFLIIENSFLRFLWVFVFVLNETKLASKRVIAPIADILEAIRRFLWNFIRLENEHLYNCGKFRAVRDIAVHVLEQPLHGSDTSFSDGPQKNIKARKTSFGFHKRKPAHIIQL